MIVGADPSRSIKKLGSIKGVTVTGSVPDVSHICAKCAVNVAPIEIARGTQNKILESLAMGIPVVTTNVAAEGVDAQPGEHFLVGSNHEEFAEAVIRLLTERELRQSFQHPEETACWNAITGLPQ
jgi:glycosyltransferase involved in cell wall biosynthesis